MKDPEPLLYHGEMIYRDGKPVGYCRSGEYGHTLGAAVGLVLKYRMTPVIAGKAIGTLG